MIPDTTDSSAVVVDAAATTSDDATQKRAQDRRDELTHQKVKRDNVLVEYTATGERMTLAKAQWDALGADDLLPSPDQTLRVPKSAFTVVADA